MTPAIQSLLLTLGARIDELENARVSDRHIIDAQGRQLLEQAKALDENRLLKMQVEAQAERLKVQGEVLAYVGRKGKRKK